VTVDGSLNGDVYLNGGRLDGNGLITGDVHNTGGTAAPGHSIGVLAIGESDSLSEGNYTQGRDGVLEIEIRPADDPQPGVDYDQLAGAGLVKGPAPAFSRGGGTDKPSVG